MRITGGFLCGRQVKVPPGRIRPAMDKMREAVFAVLGDIQGLSFLDIFSGSGIIALEAASRGASYIEAVEMDPLKRHILLENSKMSTVRINCRFIPAERYIKRAKRPFDIIFCDPPFAYKYKAELLLSIAESALVKNDTYLLVHHPGENFDNLLSKNILQRDNRKFGRSVVDFFTFNKL